MASLFLNLDLSANVEENGIVLSFYATANVLKILSEPQLTMYKFIYVSA